MVSCQAQPRGHALGCSKYADGYLAEKIEGMSDFVQLQEASIEGEIETGENLVYQSIDESGNIQYVGRTNNFARRAAAHLRLKGIEISNIRGLSNLSMYDAKAVEQVLIEFHGLGSEGGTLMNLINGIAESNPIYAQAAERGLQILRAIGYSGI
jgi:hypothetical protein